MQAAAAKPMDAMAQETRVLLVPPAHRPTLVTPHEEVAAGSVLLKSGTLLPATLRLHTRRIGTWKLVREMAGFALDRKLRDAGWNFFFLVPAFNATAIGLNRHRTVGKALGRVLQEVETKGFNAAEITTLKHKPWLGLHYVNVMAHPRHIRPSPYLGDPDPHHYPTGLWDFKRIFDVMNRKRSQSKAM